MGSDNKGAIVPHAQVGAHGHVQDAAAENRDLADNTGAS